MGVDFSRDQREDPTLSWAYEQLAMINRGATDPQRANQWPQFELTNDHLYLIDRNPQTQETQTLLVPWCHRCAVSKLVQNIPIAGHLGHERTLA
ncbi:unnamed protein product [Caretta caretta]